MSLGKPICVVCMEKSSQAFTPNECEHAVCQECMTEHLLRFVESAKTYYLEIPCLEPTCQHAYKAEEIVPQVLDDTDMVQGWWRSVIERTAMDSVGTCPYPDCQGIFELFPDNQKDSFAECFDCHRGICINCETIWHSGKCGEDTSRRGKWERLIPFRKETTKLEREHSVMAKRLAEEKGWTRCPSCKHMVDRKDGCNSVLCRCGNEFCYRCGSPSTSHVCSRNCSQLSTLKLRQVRKAMYA